MRTEENKETKQDVLSSARPTINKIQNSAANPELTSCLDIPWRQSFLDLSSV